MGLNLLELAQRAHLLFENQPPAEKRRLLDFVLSNCTWKDGELEPEYRNPFDLLAFAASADRELQGSGRGENVKSEIWLPGMDTIRIFAA